MFKRCLLVYFALSLLLSQAYLPVFKHTCLAMGREWTKVLKEPNSCCKKRPKDPPVIRVEDDAAEVATLARVPCCEDELKYVGIASLTSTVSYKDDHPGNQYSNSDFPIAWWKHSLVLECSSRTLMAHLCSVMVLHC